MLHRAFSLKSKNEFYETSWQHVLYRADVYILALLFLAITLYQLQLLLPQLGSFHVREILYVYLYARVVFFYRWKLTKVFLALLVFLVLTVFVAIYTYFSYGLEVAIHGFTRFIHVALLAPLAALILTSDTDLKLVVALWLLVVVAGVITVIYQIFGGEMPWLVQQYTAIRGDLVRHKSLLGEPNVGGMAAVLAYLIASISIRNTVCKYIVLLSTSFLIVVCLSKAALAAFVIANTMILALNIYKNKKDNLQFLSNHLVVQFFVMSIWFTILFFYPLTERYIEVAINSFFGHQPAVPGAIEDFSDRFIFLKYGGDSFSNFFGRSFGFAGSAALELKVPDAVGPHNMYLEIYLVGGLFMLISFATVQLSTIIAFVKRIDIDPKIRVSFLAVFVLISLYMTGYPNIYEPITGSIFWLIVGFICRSRRDSVSEQK